jgi:hypothetical protein
VSDAKQFRGAHAKTFGGVQHGPCGTPLLCKERGRVRIS